jgi:hypothetical protein
MFTIKPQMITNQAQWVSQCLLRYSKEALEGYRFENAHFPKSRELGGKTTVRLWKPDHIVQGILQTFEYKFPCIFVGDSKRERQILAKVYPEYLPLYDQAYTFCQSFAGMKTVQNGVGIHSEDYKNSDDRIANCKKGGVTAGNKSKQEGKGIFAPELQNPLTKSQNSRKGGISTMKSKKGIFAKVSKKKRQANCRKGAKAVNSQIWASLADGFTSTASGVVSHNKALGVGAEMRVQIS